MVRDCPECYEDGFQAGAEAMLQQIRAQGIPPKMEPGRAARVAILKEKAKPKRKPSARNIQYSKNWKKVESQFKKKNGSWKKNGFKNCAKKANAMCK
jgi:hypothetical protein